MDDAIRQFLAHLEANRHCAANTLLAYKADLNQLAQVLSRRLGRPARRADLTPDMLAYYVSWLSSQGYRATTVSRKMAAVRSFLDHHGRHQGEDAPRLLAALHSPPAPKQRPRVLTTEEVQALLQAPDRRKSPRGLRDTAVLALLYATGMRASEVVALRVEDIDLGRGVVFRRGASANDDQALPLGPAAERVRRYLQEGRPLLARNPAEPALFLNQRGRHLSRQGLWLVIKRWAAASGLKDQISLHTLRHTLATHLLDSGKTRRQVQRLLGLNSPNVLGRRRRAPDPR
ncbi:MAG: tyrosine-type recombinase/integrase [Chloroflexota bacterium]